MSSPSFPLRFSPADTDPIEQITSTSRIVQDFARRYGDHMHQTSRTGPSLSTLPSLVEIEDMISKSRSQHDALNKIRDTVITQQIAYEQQMADQRAAASAAQSQQQGQHQQQQPKALFATSSDSAPPPSTSGQRQQYQDFQQYASDDDSAKGTGEGNSNKKLRRGRAAPPGRCHSCNRADTPEWRRGPDGARTLCNACGLHYAKLTRKQQSGAAAAAAAGKAGSSAGGGGGSGSGGGASVLRPKE